MTRLEVSIQEPSASTVRNLQMSHTQTIFMEQLADNVRILEVMESGIGRDSPRRVKFAGQTAALLSRISTDNTGNNSSLREIGAYITRVLRQYLESNDEGVVEARQVLYQLC